MNSETTLQMRVLRRAYTIVEVIDQGASHIYLSSQKHSCTHAKVNNHGPGQLNKRVCVTENRQRFTQCSIHIPMGRKRSYELPPREVGSEVRSYPVIKKECTSEKRAK